MPASLKKDPEREREPDMQVIRSPVLRRQQVRDVFNSDVAAFNQVIFDSRRGKRSRSHGLDWPTKPSA